MGKGIRAPLSALRGRANLAGAIAIGLGVFAGPSVRAEDEFSPTFLGMYRKTIVIEQQLFLQAARYGVDPRLARALIMQESGGNPDLVSATGARGYFQLLPTQFQQIGVSRNEDNAEADIEAGIKRLSLLQQTLEREDYVIAAYRNVSSIESVGQPLHLTSLQYVMQVRHYKLILCLNEAEVRRQAEKLQLLAVEQGDSWSSLAQLTQTSEALLRLYNPMLASYPVQGGRIMAHPVLESRASTHTYTGTRGASLGLQKGIAQIRGATLSYTSRIGDSAVNLARVFGADLEVFRQEHQLWQLQQFPVGIRFTATLPSRTRPAPRRIQPQPLHRSPLLPVASRTRRYTVQPGDTLIQIARRHGISVQALMRANRLNTPHLQIGDALRIPGSNWKSG